MTRSRVRLTCLALLATSCLSPAAVLAATVRRAEETTLTGKLTALRDGKLLVLSDGAAATVGVPLDDIVEVTLTEAAGPATRASTQPATAPATTQPVQSIDNRPWQLKLATPDTLTLSAQGWSEGRVIGMVADHQSVDLPVSALRELWCGSAEQISAAKALGENASTDDIAFAVRDKKVIAVHGVAEGVSNGALQFKFGDQTRTIALARLVGVVFAKSAATDAAFQQSLVFPNGDSLPGIWTGIDDASLTLTTAWGQTLTFTRRSVAKVSFRNGRVVSLSDLKPASVEQTPFFDRLLPWQIDRGLDGKPLQLADGPIARGLAVHSRTVLTYSLGGAFTQFRSHVGFQLPGGKLGEAVVRVKGDGKTLFEKNDAKGAEPPFDINVAVDGVQSLTLEVDFGANQDVGDRVVWGNARLVRPQSPATQPALP